MTKSNININEGQVTFKRVEGHKHDGLTSSLIDTSKYSIFDFIASENTKDVSRRSRQENNKNVLRTFIVDTIEGRVLNPEGIRIQANTITAREIVAGTITADELSSNIVLVNNVIRSANYVNNSDTKSGWAILSNGSADFLNVNIRGNIASGTGVYANVNTPFYADINGLFSLKNKFTWDGNSLSINANNVTLGSNFIWNGSTLSINGNVSLTNTNLGTFDNGDSLTDGFIGGININGSEIQSNGFSSGSSGFRISANGNAEFNNVIVRGTIEASGGNIGGWDLNGYDLTGGTFVGDGTNGSYAILDGDGYIVAYRQNPDIGLGTFWTRIDLNKTNPGLTVTGTASGSVQQTRIVSSFIETPTIFLNGTSIATSLAGKASSTHLHDSTYVNTDGDTMTGILNGTGIDMSGNIRFGGKCYSSDTSFTNFGSVGGVPSGAVILRANTSVTLYNRSITPSGTNRAVYINSENTLFCAPDVSSLRYKNNVSDAEIDTKSFLKLKVVNFYYNDDLCDLENQPEKELHLGIIAEDAHELGLFDLLRYDDQERPDVLKKESLTFYLIKTCQIQQDEINDLKIRIQTLEGV
jgi:hypothetical protein